MLTTMMNFSFRPQLGGQKEIVKRKRVRKGLQRAAVPVPANCNDNQISTNVQYNLVCIRDDYIVLYNIHIYAILSYQVIQVKPVY
jgi:hypothetical protein